MDDLTDEKLMKRAIHMAKLSKNRGNGAFGAVLARGSVVLFEGENTVTEDHEDYTCHAEMNALREACKFYQKSDFKNFTLYCSTEPCPMCAGAAYYCGVGRVVYGMPAAAYIEATGDGLSLGCREVLATGLGHHIEIRGPFMEAEARLVHGW